jgi:hypothetical protein
MLSLGGPTFIKKKIYIERESFIAEDRQACGIKQAEISLQKSLG